eukprot:CAMPEP_0113565958 /NCGR_PEP_ID=MMETSP0015_2-20120614/22459_1 /TAXON_ID=2838 /ORGANISM="Odontella" /LENGTH=137 /DNA_ID=CAMNT_0000468199 /DNA_START=341 /DNA_END=754 /DNA_ORIENTATION=- /assembly_acc=CAM_ASM_000160
MEECHLPDETAPLHDDLIQLLPPPLISVRRLLISQNSVEAQVRTLRFQSGADVRPRQGEGALAGFDVQVMIRPGSDDEGDGTAEVVDLGLGNVVDVARRMEDYSAVLELDHSHPSEEGAAGIPDRVVFHPDVGGEGQ